MKKIDQLMKILDQIGEIYPELDKVVVDNVDSPSYFIIASTEYLESMSELLGMSLMDDLEEYEQEQDEDDIPSLPGKKKGIVH